MTKKELLEKLSNPEIPDNAVVEYMTIEIGESFYAYEHGNTISSCRFYPGDGKCTPIVELS